MVEVLALKLWTYTDSWLSGQFIGCPTEDTENLALAGNCHLSYCCFEFPHLLNTAILLTLFKHKFNFPHFLFCRMLPSHFAFHFVILISPPHLSIFFPFLILLLFLLSFPSFILFSFSFSSQYFAMSSFLLFHLPSFFFLPPHSLFCLPFYSVPW